jgi:DNA-directed RNA polymerase subunit RPC12/RpoP
MELKEKVAYIKGMMEGMEYDEGSKGGKMLAALVDLLSDMAQQISVIDEDVDELYDAVDSMSEDLEDVESYLFDDEDDEDEDEDDYEGVFDSELYEITCPKCGEVVCVDEEMLSDDNLACPNCGTKFEVDFSDDEDDCEGCCGCGCDSDEE